MVGEKRKIRRAVGFSRHPSQQSFLISSTRTYVLVEMIVDMAGRIANAVGMVPPNTFSTRNTRTVADTIRATATTTITTTGTATTTDTATSTNWGRVLDMTSAEWNRRLWDVNGATSRLLNELLIVIRGEHATHDCVAASRHTLDGLRLVSAMLNVHHVERPVTHRQRDTVSLVRLLTVSLLWDCQLCVANEVARGTKQLRCNGNGNCNGNCSANANVNVNANANANAIANAAPPLPPRRHRRHRRHMPCRDGPPNSSQ